MTPYLLNFLCEPITHYDLELKDSELDNLGNIISGKLVSKSGNVYPIKNGIPRFVDNIDTKTVTSFGDEWNHFNFIDFKVNWIEHTVKNTFGSTDYFLNQIIVDAGGGSGSQTKWFLEYGAKHVILMDLSHSVDDVIQRNLKDIDKQRYDIIQCSIDSPPLKNNSIKGIVYCHNVIQHTPSVENTAQALFNIVAEKGEFVFNCYPLNDKGALRWTRFHLIYKPLRWSLSKMPFAIILLYSRLMGLVSLVPIFGLLFEKAGFYVMGDVPTLKNESFFSHIKRKFKTSVLNTFDCFGSHTYQHLKRDEEILELVKSLQSDDSKVKNKELYFLRPQPIGCALRVFR